MCFITLFCPCQLPKLSHLISNDTNKIKWTILYLIHKNIYIHISHFQNSNKRIYLFFRFPPLQAECPPIQMEPVDLTVNKSEDGSRRNCDSPELEEDPLRMDNSTSDSEDSATSPSSYSSSWNSLLWGTSSSSNPPSTCIDLRVKKGKENKHNFFSLNYFTHRWMLIILNLQSAPLHYC